MPAYRRPSSSKLHLSTQTNCLVTTGEQHFLANFSWVGFGVLLRIKRGEATGTSFRILLTQRQTHTGTSSHCQCCAWTKDTTSKLGVFFSYFEKYWQISHHMYFSLTNKKQADVTSKSNHALTVRAILPSLSVCSSCLWFSYSNKIFSCRYKSSSKAQTLHLSLQG